MLDIVITGGEVHDGSGSAARADVGIAGDRIAAVSPPGQLAGSGDADVIDAAGKVVCPGFINILSHSYYSILADPRSLGELTQGVTTQIFGEGTSMGPLTTAMQAEMQAGAGELGYEVSWRRLTEYLHHVERRGSAQNVASFIGAETIRAHVVGYDDRPATKPELDRMRALVAEEMASGALGIGSSLIYPPGSYASTAELTALCQVAARYGGRYASHVRDEGPRLLSATKEFLTICRDAGLPGEHWHLKASGSANWHLMEGAIDLLAQARSAGLPVTADVYPYTASSTGLTTIIPDRFHAGGPAALYDRLTDPRVRSEIAAELAESRRFGDVSAAENVLILHALTSQNRRYQGCTLAEVAADRGVEPIVAAMDLISSDRSRIGVAFFSMSEDNLRMALQLPWVSICSDGASMAPEGVFLRAPTHPRAYGSFARVLGHYARDEKVLTLADAIRRMTALPAQTLGLAGRGQLTEGSYADVVIFDPETVADRATFASPHELATGVTEVLVNGRPAIRAGSFTGTLAGRALAGPGARP